MKYELIHSNRFGGGSHGGGSRGRQRASHKYTSREWKNGRWYYTYEKAKNKLINRNKINSRDLPIPSTSGLTTGANVISNHLNSVNANMTKGTSVGANAVSDIVKHMQHKFFDSIVVGHRAAVSSIIDAVKRKSISEVVNKNRTNYKIK